MKIRFYSVFLVVAVIARCRCRAPLILIALIYIRLLKVRTRLTVWHFVLQAHREGGQTSLEQVMDGAPPLARGYPRRARYLGRRRRQRRSSHTAETVGLVARDRGMPVRRCL